MVCRIKTDLRAGLNRPLALIPMRAMTRSWRNEERKRLDRDDLAGILPVCGGFEGTDNPSLGIILCAEKDNVEVEYALKTKRNPIGVAVYQLQSKLPGELKGKLPTAKQLSEVVRSVLPERNGKG